MSGEPTPFVTVIVPVRNEAKFIEATVTKLATQDYPTDRFEVIVADGLSTDDTAAIVRRLQDNFPNVRLISIHGGFRAARNLGVHFGQGDCFVVVGGHCDIGDRNYLNHVSRPPAERRLFRPPAAARNFVTAVRKPSHWPGGRGSVIIGLAHLFIDWRVREGERRRGCLSP